MCQINKKIGFTPKRNNSTNSYIH